MLRCRQATTAHDKKKKNNERMQRATSLEYLRLATRVYLFFFLSF